MRWIIYLQRKRCPPILDIMIGGIRNFVNFAIFHIFEKKNAKTSFRLEIKRSNIFLHKKCRLCILSLKNIAAIPLLQQFRIPRQMASQYKIIYSAAKGLLYIVNEIL